MNMKTNALFAAVLLAGYAFGLPLNAAALTLTRGPYLQLGTQSSIVVRWRTDTATNSRVRYGTNLSNLSSVVDDATSATEHVVKLTSLKPSTKYYYSVGHSAATLAGDSNHFFVTAPTAGTEQPTHIWVLGNSGTANAKARAVRDAYLKYKGNQYTHLWLMLGDNAYQNGTDSDYQDAVFNTYPTLLRQTTLWPTFGHRDAVTADSASQSGAYYDIFTLPKQGEAGGLASGTEAYYSFDYGNIHFVVLDSVESSKAPAGAMLTWLKNDLAATTQAWIIAYWHHPPYSKGFHDSDTGTALREMRNNALPILEDASVDLVLNGHSGAYERSFLIDGHYGSSGTFDPKTMLVDGGDGRIDGDGEYQKLVTDKPIRGAVYTVVGSSGETRGGSLDHPVMHVSINTLGSMVLDVNGPVLDAVFLDDTGQVRDRFRMVKTTDTAKVSSSAAGVPTTEVSPTSQIATVDSASGGTVSDAADSVSSGSSIASATTQGVPTTGTLNADKVSTAPVIDGQLSESGWNLQTNVTKSVIGTGNNTTTFDALWDSTYLYVGVKVLDSTLHNDSANIWEDDSVEIYIDSNHSHSTTYDATDLQLIKGYNDAALYATTNNNTSGVLHKWASTPGGYTVELAIPWTKLGVTPSNSMTIGFDVGVNDDDTGGGRDSQMLWTTPTAFAYRDTSGFGHAALVATSDTTAPSTPTGLTATASSSSQINLSWSASTDNVGVTGYKVYRGGAQIATTTGISYSNTGLSPSVTYSYTVSAYDAAGNTSAQSTSVSATTRAGSAYAVSAYPSTVAAGGTITVSWTAPVNHSTTDWVGIFAQGAADSAYNAWRYVPSGTSGTLALPASGDSGSPLPAGTYEVRYYLNNGFTRAATGNTVTVSGTSVGNGTSAIPNPTKTAPIVNVKSFGAKGDGVADDTTAIQKAMDSMTNGGTLEFPAGTYKYSNELKLTRPNVKLWGYGATLTPTNRSGNAIWLQADNTHAYGFTRTSPSSWGRDCGGVGLAECYGFFVYNSRNHEVIDTATNYGLTGVLIQNAHDVLIARNTVYRTTADAIHITGGSTNIRVLQNTVRENGDDMVGVAGYDGNGNEPAMSNILIEGNDFSGNYWGRGIAVFGAKNVTIRNNTISKVGVAAGIYIAAEDGGWNSGNNRNILVEGNVISDNQTTPPAYQPGATKTGHSGIYVVTTGPGAMSDLMFRNNKVDNTWTQGIRVAGNVSRTSVINTTMTRIGMAALAVDVAGIYCSGNTDDGSSVTDPQCTASSPSSVTGSSFP